MNITLKFKTNLKDYFSIYLSSLILVFLFFSLKLKFAKFDTNNEYLNKTSPLFIFFLLFLFTLPIYLLGLDWGRFISMAYFSSYFIYIFLIKKKIYNLILKIFSLKNIFRKNYSFIFIILYAFSWTFPFYDASSFKYPLKKPFNQLQKIIN